MIPSDKRFFQYVIPGIVVGMGICVILLLRAVFWLHSFWDAVLSLMIGASLYLNMLTIQLLKNEEPGVTKQLPGI